MSASDDTSEQSDRRKLDRRILQSFSITFSLFFTILLAGYANRNWQGLLNIFDVFFLSLNASFFITGILVWNQYGKRGIIPSRTMIRRYAIASVVMAVFATALIVHAIVATESPPDTSQILVGSVFIYLGMILAIFLIFVVFTVMGFGLLGILSIIQRLYTGGILVKVRDITPNTLEFSRIPRKRSTAEYSLYRWLFNLHPSLDTRTLKIDPAPARTSFPWRLFGSALIWMIFFNTILAIYVSLNPFLLGFSDFQTLFNISINLSLVIPIFIIPWFIYMRLNARIEGPVRDFKLFDGIRSRMVGTLVAFGTLIVFVRFALRDIDAFEILFNFAVYYVFLVLATFIFAFVYFNYFEDDLASVVTRDYHELTSEPA